MVNAKFTCKINYLGCGPFRAAGVIQMSHRQRLAPGHKDILMPRRKSLTVRDRKSTRLNSSHDQISYAVFCLKKKKKHKREMLSQKENDPEITLLPQRTHPLDLDNNQRRPRPRARDGHVGVWCLDQRRHTQKI